MCHLYTYGSESTGEIVKFEKKLKNNFIGFYLLSFAFKRLRFRFSRCFTSIASFEFFGQLKGGKVSGREHIITHKF